MAKTYSLADLVPEYDEFEDNDGPKGQGTKYRIMNARAFSTFQLAELTRMQRLAERATQDFNYALTHPSEADDDEANRRLVKAQKLMAEALDSLLHMVIPDMPRDRLAVMPVGEKEKFFLWWQAQNAPAVPAQAAVDPKPAAGRSTRRRSSPGLSGRTRSIRSAS